jgi:fimbrial isopeptide formation D2 family protein/LPXTG-motif cell wall-anchored protein
MKTAKKLVSILLAVMMIVVTAVSVGATTDTLTKHDYEAYKIFSGSQLANTTQLGNIQWGSGVNSANFLAALKASTVFGEGESNIFYSIEIQNSNDRSAALVAEKMSTYANKSAEANEFARLAYLNKKTVSKTFNQENLVDTTSDDGEQISAETFEPGYYLLVDVTDFSSDAEDMVKNIAIVRTTENNKLEVESKTSHPTIEKKVQEINDSTTDAATWGDSADHDLNDDVKFQLTATLPNHYTDYVRYKLVFHDTLSKGLTYNTDSITIKVGDNTFTKDSDYTVSTETLGDDKGTGITITFADLKKSSKKDQLTNESKIVVEYSAKLNSDAVIGSVGNPNEVYLEYSNNPNDTGSGDIETGNTPKDEVIVYTYKLVVNKTDNGNQPLTGAGFTLFKYNANSEETNEIDKYEQVGSEQKGDNLTTFTFERLDAGKYMLRETTVPTGYNQAEDLYFAVTKESSADGMELKVSSTFTTLDDLKKVNPQATTESLNATKNAGYTTSWSAGSISTTVVNSEGGTLPSTGGMGTTLFTVCGLILMSGAAILLVTRKRMSK